MQMLSVTAMVDFHLPRVERLLADRDEWLLFVAENDAMSNTDWTLDGRTDGDRIGVTGVVAVRNRHMDSHLASLNVTILNEIREAQRVNRPAVCPRIDFFHRGVDYRAEVASALRRW